MKQIPSTKRFEIPDWNRLEINTAKFLLDEGEKLLKGQIEVAEGYTKRAEAILRFTVPILTGLLVYIFGCLNSSTELTYYFGGVCYVALFLVFIIFFGVELFWVYPIAPVGNEPMNIYNKDNLENEKQYLAFVVARIYSIQDAIEFNKDKNTIRLKKLNKMYYTIVGGLTLAIPLIIFFAFIS